MNITIFMTESHNGIIDKVRYFNAKDKMMTIDLSILKLKADSVDNEKLASIIESAEYSIEVE